MNFDALKQLITIDLSLPDYQFKSLANEVKKPKFTSYDQITSWPIVLRKTANQTIPFNSYVSANLITGENHGAKALLTFKDHVSTETVLIPTKPDHYSVCLSCQSGCAMGCTFCATGKLGLTRSLTAEEICDQFFYWLQTYPEIRPKSVVFMGMGEPFSNQLEVFKAVSWLNQYYGLGFRHQTISTCGLPSGITALADAYPQVNLAISLHAANQALREQLMPIAKQISLSELAQALQTYLSLTNRQVTFEYLLINELNDTPAILDQLVAWLGQFPKHLIHVNLIGYNPTVSGYTRPSGNRIYSTLHYLEKYHLSVTIRKSFGEDIIGACGQLALSNSC